MEKFRLFKNTFFPSAKCNSWDVYWSCNKRFFAYYTFMQYKFYFIHKNGKKSVKIIKNIQKYT